MPIVNEIQAKAKELKINPKLLLFASAILTEKPDATFNDVLPRYFQSLVEDMKEQAEKQLTSRSANIRAAGEKALSPFTEVEEELFNRIQNLFQKPLPKDTPLVLPKDTPLIYLHLSALGVINKEIFKIMKAYITTVSDINIQDPLQMLKYMFPELLCQFKDFALIFKADLSTN